jgi:hypothetical protein
MQLLNRLSLFSVSCVVLPTICLAQTTAQVAWQLSLDNGTTWQSGNLVAPQSQASVLVQAQVTVFDNGVPFLSQARERFAEAAMEAYVRSPLLRSDSVTSVQTLQSGLPARLFNAPFATSQHGDIFKIDNVGDTSSPGQGTFLSTRNIVNATGSTTVRTNPLVILQYRLQLDGLEGDRTFDGGFLAFTGVTRGVAGANQLLAYPATGALTTSPINVTQTPTTLTIIHTPTTLAIFTISSLFATRRRR